MTIKAALDRAKRALEQSDVPNASVDAHLFLAFVLGVTQSRLRAHSENVLGEKESDDFFARVERRRGGEPAAYIVGHREFRYLDLNVNSSVLIPRPETETLVEAALEALKAASKTAPRVLDLCTGSGAVGLALKDEAPFSDVTLSDVSPAALLAAKENALKHGLDVKLVLSDLFDGISGRFDIVVSNPPYVKTGDIPALPREVRNEPRLALDGGAAGLTLINKIIPAAKPRLNRGGCLLLEADPAQMSAIKALLSQNGYADITILKDLAGLDRVITAVSGWSASGSNDLFTGGW